MKVNWCTFWSELLVSEGCSVRCSDVLFRVMMEVLTQIVSALHHLCDVDVSGSWWDVDDLVIAHFRERVLEQTWDQLTASAITPTNTTSVPNVLWTHHIITAHSLTHTHRFIESLLSVFTDGRVTDRAGLHRKQFNRNTDIIHSCFRVKNIQKIVSIEWMLPLQTIKHELTVYFMSYEVMWHISIIFTWKNPWLAS